MIRIDKELSSAAEVVQKAKASLDYQKSLKKGNYNTEEVVNALDIVFHGKCYLCENKLATSIEIEHLRPCKNDIDKKFDWENLFLSCRHCNNIKSSHYEHLLDCSKVDVDQKIAFRRKGSYLNKNQEIEISPLSDEPEVLETVDLLRKVYHGNTPQKILESNKLKDILTEELIKFKRQINLYEESIGEDKEDARLNIIAQLKPSSPFAAFKRWIIRDQSLYLPDIKSEYIPEIR